MQNRKMTATTKENQRQNGQLQVKEDDWDVKMNRRRQELIAVVERSATKAAQKVHDQEEAETEEMDANGQGKRLYGIDDELNTPVREKVFGGSEKEHLHLGDLTHPQLRPEQLGRAAVLKWNPTAKTSTRTPPPSQQQQQRYSTPISARRSPTSPTRAIRFSGSNGATPSSNAIPSSSSSRREKMRHRTYSKDIVQQVIDYEQQQESASPLSMVQSPSPIRYHSHPHPHQLQQQHQVEDEVVEQDSIVVPLEVRQRVKEMENTINKLQLQKEELVRNQVEFDKHADDIFPSLEKISLQLSQIVQNPMAMSQVSIREEVFDEICQQRTALSEVETEMKQIQEQTQRMEQTQKTQLNEIQTQMVNLLNAGKQTEERIVRVSQTMEQVQYTYHENQEELKERLENVENIVASLPEHLQNQLLLIQEKSINKNGVRGSMIQPLFISLIVCLLAVVVGGLVASDGCIWMTSSNFHCQQLT